MMPTASAGHAERKRIEEQLRRKQEDAIQIARGRWASAIAINGTPNPYLERKNVAPYGCRCEGRTCLCRCTVSTA
jgi:hypothetical protein